MKKDRKPACCSLSLLALVVLVMFIIFPGLHDYHCPLSGGYQMTRPYSGGNAIADREGWYVIGPFVDRYQIVKRLVVGHVSPHPSFDKSKKFSEIPGYFILDTRTDKIQKGLKRSDWESALHAYGVSSPPKLIGPNMINAMLRWLPFY